MINKKILSRKKIASIVKSLQKEGKKVGFSSGSFDVVHAGHAIYLEKAKKKCDVLIIGVNSDLSVKKYKGEDRPIIAEKARIKMIAALDSVDYVFLFDERRNKNNIEEIKPDYYIKAGDYKKEELTSAKYLEPYGGKIILIPFEKGYSTTKIIEKIVKLYSDEKSDKYSLEVPKKSSPAVFIDRDGVINEEIHFLHEPEKFKLLPNVIEGLKKLQNMHYRLIIVTNQCGIGLGYFTKEDFFKVNSKMLKEFSNNDIAIDKVYFCPHSLSEECECRKPNIGMFERGKQELNIDMKNSYTIGDKSSDIEAGKKAGTKTILMTTGYSGKDSKKKVKPNFIAKDLVEAAKYIHRNEN